MKKAIVLALIITLIIPSLTFSDVISFEGGLKKEPTMNAGIFYYEEVTFLSGKAIKMIGTVEVPSIPENQNNFNIVYGYEMQDKAGTAFITREVTYAVEKIDEDIDNSYTQTRYNYTLTDIDEDILIEGNEYNLASVEELGTIVKTIIYDNAPGIGFYVGQLSLNRMYFINGDLLDNEGIVNVKILSDQMVGYNHYWGNAETNILNMTIDTELMDDTGSATTWFGLITLNMSTSTQKSFEKQSNDLQTISFRENYYQKTTEENILQYKFDLPSFNDDGSFSLDAMGFRKRNEGEVSISSGVKTSIESLVIPKYKDIESHWAEETVFLLGSLKILDSENYFAPDAPITRLEFARTLARSIKDFPEYTEEELLAEAIKRDRPGEDPIFKDIDIRDPDYHYIEFLKDQGLMKGEGGYFLPDRTITRSEAIAIMIRALGIEHMAPNPPYTTRYVDDASISIWAKDYIYVADEINLVKGYSDGTIKPNNLMTRAEASSMILNFIYHIKDSIQYDYREKLINRN